MLPQCHKSIFLATVNESYSDIDIQDSTDIAKFPCPICSRLVLALTFTSKLHHLQHLNKTKISCNSKFHFNFSSTSLDLGNMLIKTYRSLLVYNSSIFALSLGQTPVITDIISNSWIHSD